MATTIYTSANAKYYDFIPLFCAANLWCCPNDTYISIGLSNIELSDNNKMAVDNLNENFGNKVSLIPNQFIENGSAAILNGDKMFVNTIRFLTEPSIKSDYVYISDIDIISMVPDYFQYLIKDMKDKGRRYSNMVRKNSGNPPRMTGLHFSEWGAYYPIDSKGINLSINDEQILHELVKKHNTIDYKTTYRPVFGIHMSPNRPYVKGQSIPGWGAELYKEKWIEFTNTEYYKSIEELLGPLVQEQINKLNEYYKEI